MRLPRATKRASKKAARRAELGVGWSQLTSIRTFDPWLRDRRSGWPAATRRPGVRDTRGVTCVDHDRRIRLVTARVDALASRRRRTTLLRRPARARGARAPPPHCPPGPGSTRWEREVLVSSRPRDLRPMGYRSPSPEPCRRG